MATPPRAGTSLSLGCKGAKGSRTTPLSMEILERRDLLASFTPLEYSTTGVEDSRALAISGDGSAIAGERRGFAGLRPIRWTPDGSISLGYLPHSQMGQFSEGSAAALSSEGSVIVGRTNVSFAHVSFDEIAFLDEAFRWTEAGGMVGLGPVPSAALGVSEDGSVIVGEAWTEGVSWPFGGIAFRWSEAEGLTTLGDLPGGEFQSSATALSADGTVVVGMASSDLGTEAFRWTAIDGMVGLGELPGGSFHSEASAISANGAVIVGWGMSHFGTEAFRWTTAEGMVPLGGLVGGEFFSKALGVSADGSVIVGTATDDAGEVAVYWDQAGQIHRLQSLLIDDSDPMLAQWRLTTASAVSNDGTTIAGWGDAPDGATQAWRGNLTPSLPNIQSLSAQLTDANSLYYVYATTDGITEFSVGIYYSADDRYDASDVLVDRNGDGTADHDDLTLLSVSASGTGQTMINMAEPLRPDPARPFVLLVADPGSLISETDKLDNVALFEQDILEWYSPILHVFDHDFRPKSIEAMLDRSRLVLEGNEVLAAPSKGDLAQGHTDSAFLDMRDAEGGSLPCGFGTECPLPSDFALYATTVYGRKSSQVATSSDSFSNINLRPGEAYSMLQYWFFYPYNDWSPPEFEAGNRHEGDWEMVQIIIDPKTLAPVYATYSWHLAGKTYDWSTLQKDNDHPRVYVTDGGHGSWPSGGDHVLSQPITAFTRNVIDRTPPDGKGTQLHREDTACAGTCEPYELEYLPDADWNDFRGRWGQVSLLSNPTIGTAGPHGPKYTEYFMDGRDGRWADPLTWADDPAPAQWSAEAHSPVDMSVIDSAGRRVGTIGDGGQIESNIPGTYYFWPSDTDQEAVSIVTDDRLSFQLKGTDYGTMDFYVTRAGTNDGSDLFLAFENVPLSPVFAATVSFAASNPGHVMDVDADGDGTIDELRLPGPYPKLTDAIAALPDEVFAHGRTQRRTPLMNKAKAVEAMIQVGNHSGALLKLQHDVARHVDRWLADGNSSSDKPTKSVIESHIRTLVARLQGLQDGHFATGRQAKEGSLGLSVMAFRQGSDNVTAVASRSSAPSISSPARFVASQAPEPHFRFEGGANASGNVVAVGMATPTANGVDRGMRSLRFYAESGEVEEFQRAVDVLLAGHCDFNLTMDMLFAD